jgi:hypothetical protein
MKTRNNKKRNNKKRNRKTRKMNGGMSWPFNRKRCILQNLKLNEIFSKRYRELKFQDLYDYGYLIYDEPRKYNKVITDYTLSHCKQPEAVINPYLYNKIKKFILLCIQKRDEINISNQPRSEKEVLFDDFLINTINDIFSINDEHEYEEEEEEYKINLNVNKYNFD